MSLYDVAKGLTGRISNTPLALAQETVKEALGKIYDDRDWSFQRELTYGNWLCPGIVANVGRFFVTPYSNQVVADATATLAIQAYTGAPFITQLQFRNPAYSIYNVIAYDDGLQAGSPGNPASPNPGFVTLTLDRPWLEPLVGYITYMLYQCYFPAPGKDFRKFIEMRDTRRAASIDFWTMTQAELAVRDPQRTNFSDSCFAVAAGIDQRPGSATLGYQMYELWPQQLAYTPYSFSFNRRGPMPESYNDWLSFEPPYPLTNELIRWRAEEVLYQYREAQKDQSAARGSGSNWILLAQMAQKEYLEILDKILAIDVNINNEMFTRIRGRGRWPSNRPYANQLGGLNIGGYPVR